jgi:hypothetical protein
VQNQQEEQSNQVKGALFESIVRYLLAKSNFSPIPPDGRQVRRNFFNIRGRACWHNIDACGKFGYPIPYVYPIRLLAEAKCYDKNVDLSVVQSFVGVIKDISENYFIKDKMSADEMRKYQRYTDCGSIFSASDFSNPAQKFALAHGIKLVSYQNNPIIRNIIYSMNRLIPTINLTNASENKGRFAKYIDRKLNKPPKRNLKSEFINPESRENFSEEFRVLISSINNIRTSLIGVAIGKKRDYQYPIHILSNQVFPEQLFRETDTHPFIPRYQEAGENGVVFRIDPIDTDAQLFFSLPKSIYMDYYRESEMLQFKEMFMNNVEIPVTINNMRRIVRLRIDKEWLLDRQKRDQ